MRVELVLIVTPGDGGAVPADEDSFQGPVDPCWSGKDERRAAAEIELWPGAACTRHHRRRVSKDNNLNTVSDILFQVSCGTFIWNRLGPGNLKTPDDRGGQHRRDTVWLHIGRQTHKSYPPSAGF